MSKQRSLRRSRAADDDDDDVVDADAGAGVAPPAAVKAQQAQREKAARAAKGKALLSFGDDACAAGDGDGDAGAARPRPALRPASLAPGAGAAAEAPAAAPAAGEYTAERLRELQRGTPRAPRSSKPAAGAAGAAGFKLTGSFKPAPVAGGAGEPAAPEAIDEEGGSDSQGDGAFPDADAVRRARERRERLRGGGGLAAPDYIPTAGAGTAVGRRMPSGVEAAAPSSSDDGEEEREPVPFFKPSGGGGDAPVLAAAGGAAPPDDDDDDDDDGWAREQIRKGTAGAPAARGSARDAFDGVGAGRAPAAGPGAAAASGAAAVAAAADDALAALRASLARAQVARRQADAALSRTEASAAAAAADEARLEAELAAAGERFAFMQRVRAYVADLCAMQAEKSPLVEELEEQLAAARAERAAAAAAAATAADAEADAAARAAADAALRVLGAGGGAVEAAAAAAAAAAAEDARAAAGAHVPEQLDEFGRDAAAPLRAAAARRAARRAASAPAAGAADAGGATTDEDAGAGADGAAELAERVAEIRAAAAAAFRDADDDFASLDAVAARLEGWKAAHPRQYRDAYAAESAPALFAPFVRAELLSWEPLAGRGRGGAGAGAGDAMREPGVEGHAWFSRLFAYGAPPGGAHAAGDPDADLVPRLVCQLAVPAAAAALRTQWNPRSAAQSAAAAALVSGLAVYCPPGDAGLAALLDAAAARLAAAVGEPGAAVPAWPAAAVGAAPRAAAHAAARFGRALRLLRSMAAFDGLLPAPALQKLALGRLVGGQLVPYVRAAAGDAGEAARRADAVLGALPPAWLGTPPAAGSPLAALADLLRALGAAEAAAPRAGADAGRRLARCLGLLGDAAAAAAVGRAYGLPA